MADPLFWLDVGEEVTTRYTHDGAKVVPPEAPALEEVRGGPGAHDRDIPLLASLIGKRGAVDLQRAAQLVAERRAWWLQRAAAVEALRLETLENLEAAQSQEDIHAGALGQAKQGGPRGVKTETLPRRPSSSPG